MALNKVKQLVSEPHELFFYPLKVVSITNLLGRKTSQLVSPVNRLVSSSADYKL